MIEPVKLHATLKPVTQLNGTLSAGVPIPGPPMSIEDEGILLTQRPTMNFVGPGVTCTDDAINSRTVITIPGGGSQSPWTSDIDGANHVLHSVQKIGVNIAAPASPLHLDGGFAGTDIPCGAIIMSRVWIDATNTRASSIFHYRDSAWGRDILAFAVAGDSGTPGNPAQISQIKMAITAAGNVGINNTAPSYKLDIAGDCNLSAGSVYRINGVAIVQGHTILDESSTMTARGGLNFVGAGVTVTDDSGNNRTVVTIPSWPQSPWTSDIAAAGFKLNNVGQVNIQSATGVATKLNLLQASVGSWDIQVPASVNALTFSVGGAELARIGSTGNVGIGNDASILPFTTPTSTHVIVGKASGGSRSDVTIGANVGTPASIGGFNFANLALAAAEKRIAAVEGVTDTASDSGALVFNTMNLGTRGERMRLSPAGKLGIGVAGPTYGIDLIAPEDSQILLRSHTSTGGQLFLGAGIAGSCPSFQFWKTQSFTNGASIGMNTPGSASTNDLVFGLYSGGWTERMRITAAGGVAIPSLPSSNPGAGTKQLWYDPADSNRVKFAA